MNRQIFFLVTWNIFYLLIKGLEKLTNNSSNISTLVGENYIQLNQFAGQDILFFISNALIISTLETVKKNKFQHLFHIILKYIGVIIIFYLYQLRQNTLSFNSVIITQAFSIGIIALIWMVRSNITTIQFDYNKLLLKTVRLGYIPFFTFTILNFLVLTVFDNLGEEQPFSFSTLIINLAILLISNICFYFIIVSNRFSILTCFFLTWFTLFVLQSIGVYISLNFEQNIIYYEYQILLESFVTSFSLFLLIILLTYINAIISFTLVKLISPIIFWSLFIIIGSSRAFSFTQLSIQLSNIGFVSILIAVSFSSLCFELTKTYLIKKHTTRPKT